MKPGISVVVKSGLDVARAIVVDVYYASVRVRLIEDLGKIKSGTFLIVSLESIKAL